jgi:hypothetical protein
MYDFYNALKKLTDNTGLKLPKDHYKAFMRMVWQWRFLKALKRAGRGHDNRGIQGTHPGELAVICPACPQPGVNLPEGWEDVPKEKQYRLLPVLFHDLLMPFQIHLLPFCSP